MDNNKWTHYLSLSNYPSSIATGDKERMNEAKIYISEATSQFNKNGHILIVGCGDGYELKLLKELGFKNARGVTYSDKEFFGAEKEGADNADMHELPYEDATFDYVISKEVLEHSISPFIALCELNRVMKLGGKFVHYIPTGPKKQSDWYHYGCFPDWVWADIMFKAGFKTESILPSLEQLRYEGKKQNAPGWMRSMYSLEKYMYTIQRR